ncbi:MAG: SelL-related redox protein [Bryobacteraceae bacterium]
MTTTMDVYSVADLLEGITTESGRRFVDLAQDSSLLLVFLRHAGCTFCREALADISQTRRSIEAKGTKIVLVHMGDQEAMKHLLDKRSLQDLERICDPDQVLYRAFGLKRGSLPQLAGFKVWWRGFAAGILAGHGRGPSHADVRQMPGVFYLEKGMIAGHFRHKSAADRPHYDELCSPVRRNS